MKGNTLPIMLSLTITALVVAVLVYVYYKGWQVDTSVHGKQEKLPKFNVHQWLSLLGLLCSCSWGIILILECGIDRIFGRKCPYYSR